MVLRQLSQFSVPAIVLGRILAILFLLTVVAIYFVGESLGLIPPLFAEQQMSKEERAALAKHNTEVKHLIAVRNARAAHVRAADGADIAAQTARDAPPPAAPPPPSPAEPAVPIVLPVK